MIGAPRFTDGFAAPILWGTREGYTIAEIAAGLGIEQWVVVQVIEARSTVRFPAAARMPAPENVVVAPGASGRPADMFKAPRRTPQPMLLSRPAQIDPARRDPAYLAWAKSRRGATQLLGAQG